jgi:energy-coupling factor transporter ATP-binding protein EcfA2
MKIHKLWAENVRSISSRVTVELSPTGLNIINASNEKGKTTIAQVLNYIFQYKSKSKAQEILDLQPYGKDVGPLMGAIIEVNGQIYKIEKQWIKDTKAEVELVSPTTKSLSGDAAEKEITTIFTEQLDETVWRMIQVAQAEFAELLSDEYDDDQRDMLRSYLARAVVDDEEGGNESLAEKTDGEYLNWWTPKGKPATATGTSGKTIDDKTKELSKLKERISDLEGKIGEAATVEEEIVVNRDSREVLQNRKKAQDANVQLVAATRELKVRKDLQAQIDQALSDTPEIKTFSRELYDAINNDRALHAQYLALSSIKLTGLAAVDLEINGEAVAIGNGESREQKLESPLKIIIPNLLAIEYVEDGSNTATGLEEASKRYLFNLKELGCAGFKEVQTLNTKHSEYLNLCQKLETLIGLYSIELLETSIATNTAIKATLANWDSDITAPPVTTEDLEDVAESLFKKEGRSDEIARNGWHGELEESYEKVKDFDKSLKSLNMKANAARMLKEVLDEHKSSAEKDYSVYFAKYINDIAKSFYGEDVTFEVSDSFEILNRRKDSVEVNIADLSTGAKEQLAILIRLALTQIVQVGEPFPVIMDDEFAHSDPARIALMSNVFNDFGADQQFILLTCYPEKFKGYTAAKTIDLEALRGA